nr:hypothetical protein [Tanacetum cinerariifolium]
MLSSMVFQGATRYFSLDGPRKTFKMLASMVFQGAKRYFSLDDPLRLKKYFSDDHLKAFAAAQCFALELVGQSRLVSIEDFKQYAETIIALVKDYKDTFQFRATLVKKVNNWFQKEEEPKKEEEEESKPIGYTILVVKGYAVKEETIIPVEAKVR